MLWLYTYLSFPFQRSNFGAVMLHKVIVTSGGGPPIGCPRITTVSPDVTFEKKVVQKYLTLYDFLSENIYYICNLLIVFTEYFQVITLGKNI